MRPPGPEITCCLSGSLEQTAPYPEVPRRACWGRVLWLEHALPCEQVGPQATSREEAVPSIPQSPAIRLDIKFFSSRISVRRWEHAFPYPPCPEVARGLSRHGHQAPRSPPIPSSTSRYDSPRLAEAIPCEPPGPEATFREQALEIEPVLDSPTDDWFRWRRNILIT